MLQFGLAACVVRVGVENDFALPRVYEASLKGPASDRLRGTDRGDAALFVFVAFGDLFLGNDIRRGIGELAQKVGAGNRDRDRDGFGVDHLQPADACRLTRMVLDRADDVVQIIHRDRRGKPRIERASDRVDHVVGSHRAPIVELEIVAQRERVGLVVGAQASAAPSPRAG